ncbi:MAG: transpeptidase family protein [Muribaculaceae bacterium]|nr:transpeptidase family protein [Muribaculaceae bacterium]
MKQENRKLIMFRYTLITIVICLICAAIITKLVDTTVISADKWNELANKELSRVETILPERGNILADDGSILATNLTYYTVRIDYRSEKFMADTLRKLMPALQDSMSRVFGRRTPDEWGKYILAPLEKPYKKRPRAYPLLNNITYAQLQQLRTFPFFRIRNPNRNGLTVESNLRRVNPYGDMARRSVGGVGQTKECREVHGISGLERALDTLLYGVPGEAKRIPLTRGIVPWTDVPAQRGYDITTTIDIKMQDIVENELNNVLRDVNAEWGVAVLMEVPTGDIKAISNLEASKTRPGVYIEGMNRAVLGFEPGSVIKTLSMLIAIEDGIATPDEVIPIGAHYAYAGGRPISDSHFNSALKVREVIEQSSNIGMTRIITRKYDHNPGAFYSRVKSLGFLEPFNTGISGETTPRSDSVPNNRGGRITLSRQCYGYATEIPPLYTLSIYNAIANKGRYVRPRLVHGIRNEHIDTILPVTYVRDRICSERTASILTQMLTAVVWGDHGTGRRLRNDNVRIAGKTGTCYMTAPSGGYDSRKRLAFCGFFPAEDPKYSCIVLTCNPRQNAFGAASTSGEVLKNIAMKLYSRGMLGNKSDYHEGASGTSIPTFYSTINTDRQAKAQKELAMGERRQVMISPKKIAAGVPDVKGYGLRDAVAALESAGYNVRTRGVGFVHSQSLTPGTKAPRGTKVELTLTE